MTIVRFSIACAMVVGLVIRQRCLHHRHQRTQVCAMLNRLVPFRRRLLLHRRFLTNTLKALARTGSAGT
jgi:hypothetical protein